MSVKLNTTAVGQARELIEAGKVVRDERDDWSEAAPTSEEENAFIEKRGWGEYAKWHLGVDSEKSEETKGRYSFPYGDFSKVRRGGIISLESRAAQFGHDDIAKASKKLLEQIDD
ncbi:hypothetical protein [Herbiconiux solani]|uniref:hypothetical protein n=1 Tax=Herbiconiux solani TaxID=661329 RepID=UPI00082530CC|nr:hypothetical protein [Herbiconiux solani]